MKKPLFFFILTFFARLCFAQETFPVNGPYDVRPGQYAFVNATIVASAGETIPNGTLLVKDRVIEGVGANLQVPQGYVVVDLKGKYIYPALIDAYSTYGMPENPRAQAGFGRPAVYTSTKPGAYGWNEAVRPEVQAKNLFHADAEKAADFKKNGFGTVHTLVHDGIMRGTGAVVTLGDERDNFVVLNDAASANYSFTKGTAATNYPSSLMGSIALIRQTYYDADWYKGQHEEYNISLDEFNKEQSV
jgi:hypothetical protein